MVLVAVRRKFLSGGLLLRHESRLLHGATLLQGGSRAAVGAAAVAEPQEHDNLADKHSNGACGEAGEHTQNSRNHNETDHPRKSPLPAMAVVGVTVRTAAKVMGTGVRHVAIKVRGMLTMRTVREMGLAVTALTAEGQSSADAHHPGLGRSHQIPDPSKQQTSQAAWLSTALAPRKTVCGSGLNLRSGNEQFTRSRLDHGDRESVNRNGMARKVEDGEADGQEFHVILRRHQRQNLEGKTQANGGSFLPIGLSSLHGVDIQRGGRGREDLVVVDEKSVVLGRDVQQLFVKTR